MRGVFWMHVSCRGIYTKSIEESPAKFFYQNQNEYFLNEWDDDSWHGRVLKPFLNENFLLYLKMYSLTIIPIRDDLTPGPIKKIRIPKPKNALPQRQKFEKIVNFTAFKNKFLLLVCNRLMMFKMKIKKKLLC